MARGRDKNEFGADAPPGSGPVSRHADQAGLGAARHLGPIRGMPGWLKVVTAVVAVVLVGGLAFATVWTVLLGLAYVHHHTPKLNPKALSFVACAALAVFGGFNVARRHAADVERYAVREEAPVLSTAAWLSVRLAARRST